MAGSAACYSSQDTNFCLNLVFCYRSALNVATNLIFVRICLTATLIGLYRTRYTMYRSADKSLAQSTSRCISFDGENISFVASLVIYK